MSKLSCIYNQFCIKGSNVQVSLVYIIATVQSSYSLYEEVYSFIPNYLSAKSHFPNWIFGFDVGTLQLLLKISQSLVFTRQERPQKWWLLSFSLATFCASLFLLYLDSLSKITSDQSHLVTSQYLTFCSQTLCSSKLSITLTFYLSCWLVWLDTYHLSCHKSCYL